MASSLNILADSQLENHDKCEPNPAESDDFFDAILNIEETKTREGFAKGTEAQKVKLTLEGFNLGLTKGFEIGSEVSFYQSFAETWLQNPKGVSEKEQKVLEQLLKLTQEFPKDNSKEQDTKLKAINAKFKQSCAMLKIKNSSEGLRDSTW